MIFGQASTRSIIEADVMISIPIFRRQGFVTGVH
jgi:hypothetical protein